MTHDIIITGCGLAGSVIAHELAQRGLRVLMLEKRSHVGGNLRDAVDAAGIRVHLYGPHIFHTDDESIAQYVRGLGEWDDYHVRCMAQIDGQFVPTPFGFEAVDLLYPEQEAQRLKEALLRLYAPRKYAAVTELMQSADESVRAFAQLLFEKDFAPYAAKQWSVPVEEISPDVIARVPVHFSYNQEYYTDCWQMLPRGGYSALFDRLLDDERIEVRLGCDALDFASADSQTGRILWNGEALDVPFVYTGAVDALFGFAFGRLPYRSLAFRWQTLRQPQFQPAPVVAYPQAEGYTRITEYKLLTGGAGPDTTIAVEYPLDARATPDAEPYYPVPTAQTERQMERYRALAARFSGLYLCGRLAEYRYYNMDQTIASARNMAQRILRDCFPPSRPAQG